VGVFHAARNVGFRGAKQTLRLRRKMSAFDPKRTSALPINLLNPIR
jgi:hypothetical protein